MACSLVHRGRVLLALWGRPEHSDIETIVRRVHDRHREAGPLVFIARVPATAEAPDEAVRKEISRRIPTILECCASYHAVLEGSGFVAAAKRAVLTTIFNLSRDRRRYHVHPACSDVLHAIPRSYAAEVATALELFESRGLLSKDLSQLSLEAFASD